MELYEVRMCEMCDLVCDAGMSEGTPEEALAVAAQGQCLCELHLLAQTVQPTQKM